MARRHERLRFQTREKFAGIGFFFITFCPFILKTSHRVALISSHLYRLRAYSCRPLGWRYRWQHHVSRFTLSPLKRKVVGRMSCLRRALEPYHGHAHSRWAVRLWRLDVISTFSACSIERRHSVNGFPLPHTIIADLSAVVTARLGGADTN